MPTSQIHAATQELIAHARQCLENRYGEHGSTPRAYHNLEHTDEALDAATRMANLARRAGRISATEWDLTRIAVAYHDIEHNLVSDGDKGRGEDEQTSADISRRAMEDHGGFTPGHISLVSRMILATRVHLTDGIIVQQVPANIYPAMIVADADLAHFGKPFEDYWQRAVLLHRERYSDLPGNQVSIQKFTALQPRILSYHQFHTTEAKQLFPHQRDNMRRVVAMIREDKRSARGRQV